MESTSFESKIRGTQPAWPLDPAGHPDGAVREPRLTRDDRIPYAAALDRRADRAVGALAGAAKRVFDLVGSLLIILTIAPLFIVIALLVKVDSGGPALFRQHRIGRDGRAFKMLKFRTMIDGADAHKARLIHLNQAADGLFKIHSDPRVTKVGRWLRATSLDELPQLLHVVTGKMSLVGPRPLVPDEDAQIQGANRGRLSVRPGMTGPWQVGGASSIPIKEMVQLDHAYITEWSLWLDLKLLARTAWLVLGRRGV